MVVKSYLVRKFQIFKQKVSIYDSFLFGYFFKSTFFAVLGDLAPECKWIKFLIGGSDILIIENVIGCPDHP